MLKTSAHDGLPVLNCHNRWPLFKKHSGSDSSIYQTHPASIVFDSWTTPDVEEKPARYQSEKDMWWTRKASCTQHDLGSFSSHFSSTPHGDGFNFNSSWPWKSASFFPSRDAYFRNVDLEANTAGEFMHSRSGIRCAFSVVMSWLRYVRHMWSCSALQSNIYKGFISLDPPGIYIAGQQKEKHTRTKNNINSHDLN